MVTFIDLPLLAMRMIISMLDRKSTLHLSTMNGMLWSLCNSTTIWKRIFETEMNTMWDRSPDTLIGILNLPRFDKIKIVTIKSDKPRGQMQWSRLITAIGRKGPAIKIILAANVDGVLGSWLSELLTKVKCIELGPCAFMSKDTKLTIARTIARRSNTIHVRIDGLSLRDVVSRDDCKILMGANKKLWKVEARTSSLSKGQNNCLDLLKTRDENTSIDLGGIALCCE